MRQIDRRQFVLGGAVGVLGLTGALSGASKAAELTSGEVDRVARVTSGHTLELQSGLKVRLAGIRAPIQTEQHAKEARDALNDLVRQRRVRLSYGGDPRDRYDRALAQVHLLDPAGVEGLWVQSALIQKGHARVYSWPDEDLDVASLLLSETTARDASQGLWALPDYAVRSPDPNPLAQYVDSLQLVEGIVTSTADIRGRAYLNFGSDYRTDFTVAVAKKHRKRFKDVDPVSLEGARIRVRGWVELMNGPMIWVSHPERIEVLT